MGSGGLFAPDAADALARLAHRFCRHRAGIDRDRVIEPGGARVAADDFRLVGIEAAAKGDDVDAHCRTIMAPPP